ncbi:MAG: ABC transporter permease [Phototrophicaceae bacterium]
MLITIWLAITLAFFALHLLPSNVIDTQLQGSGLPQTVIDARKASLGYDKPILLQYINYLGDFLLGDWGQSLYTGQTVAEAINNRLQSTTILASYSIVLSIFLGIIFGITAGIKSKISFLARFIIDLSIGIPIYVTATVLLFLIASRIGNIQGGLLLPMIALGFHTSGAIARIIETNLQDIQTASFIQTARAKGLTNTLIIYRHMLKIALLPTIPIIALQAGVLFSGTVIIETIFSRAGLGLLLLDATLQRDYPIVQGIVVLIVIIYIVINTLSDILTQLLDPRLSIS